jgi:hypothetical protein
MPHNDHLHDAELGPVIDRLEAERPTASSLELGLIRQQVRTRVAPNARRSRRTEFMRSRLAIIGTLVLGMVLSTGGAGLAVSGFANEQDNAAATQYRTPDTGVLGEEDAGGPAGEEESGGPAGGDDEGAPAGDDDVQPARQVEAGAQGDAEEQLPFTGFAAIPILLGGVALLATGLVLRRRVGPEDG